MPQGHQAGRTRGPIQPRQIDPVVHYAISLAGHLLEWIKKEHLTDQEQVLFCEACFIYTYETIYILSIVSILFNIYIYIMYVYMYELIYIQTDIVCMCVCAVLQCKMICLLQIWSKNIGIPLLLLNKLQFVHRMEFYVALTMNNLKLEARTKMNLKNIILSRKRKATKNTYTTILFI